MTQVRMSTVCHLGQLAAALSLVTFIDTEARADDTRVFRASDHGKPGVPSLTGNDIAELREALAAVKPADKNNIWFGFFTVGGRSTFIIFNTRGYPVEGSEPYGAMFHVMNNGCNMEYFPFNHDVEVTPDCSR